MPSKRVTSGARGRESRLALTVAAILALGSASWADGQAGTRMTCDTDPQPRPGGEILSWCATSHARPRGRETFMPGNMGFSAGTTTAWCEGMAGHGLGEAIEIRLDPAGSFRTLIIWSGHQQSQDSFRDHSRPRDLTLTTPRGERFVARLSDRPGPQQIRLPRRITTDAIRLTIWSVYPGTRHDDTCVSFLFPLLDEPPRP